MELDNLAAFALIAALLTIAPGADTILVIRNTLRRRIAGGMATATGICCGLILHALISSLGLAALLAKSAFAYQGIRIMGAVYLVWLGVQSLRLGRTSGFGKPMQDVPVVDEHRSIRHCLAEGFLTNLLNPKVVLFYLAIVPQFTPPAGSLIATSLTLASLHAAMGIVWLGTLSIAAGRARKLLTRPKARSMANRLAGVALIGLGLRVATSD